MRQDRIIALENEYRLDGPGFKSRQEQEIQLVPDLQGPFSGKPEKLY